MHCFEPAEYPPTALISGLPLHQCMLWFDLLRRLGSRWPCTFEPLRSVRGGTRPEECRNSWSRFDGCLETLRAKLALGWAWRFAPVPPEHHGRCS